jgi:hypothetical protein
MLASLENEPFCHITGEAAAAAAYNASLVVIGKTEKHDRAHHERKGDV